MLRATLKGMLSRKARLLLSTIAVVLGVMFISGAVVLTDTLNRSFDNAFSDIYKYTEIDVTKISDVPSLQGAPEPIPAADVGRIKRVPGVADANGTVLVNGARVIGRDGKVVFSQMPRFGASWGGEDQLLHLREGDAPTADDQVAISANLAKTSGYGVGDTIQVKTNDPDPHTFTVTGITGYAGGRDSMVGETIVFFTEPVAQQLMLGQRGLYSNIDVDVADGQSIDEVRERIQAALGDSYDVKTGQQLADETADSIAVVFDFFDYLLIGFAAIALFVGVFLILNTFSIVVAQRTRELALFRAMGAGRAQVVGSVLTEASVVGIVAATVGLGLGIGVGALLAVLLSSALSNGQLEVAPLAVPAAAVIGSYAVGVGVTLVSALLPALRASRVPPVAAMRESAVPDKSLTAMSVSGAAVFAAGAVTLGLGLGAKLGDYNLWGVLIGILVAFVGLALLTPAVSRPVVGALGWIMSRSAAGKLGRRNSARNPRRTAITASALMIGVAIVTGISVVMSSYQRSTEIAIDEGVDAQLVIANDPAGGGLSTIDPKTLADIRAIPGVASVVGLSVDLVLVDGARTAVTGIDDTAAATSIFAVEPVSGSLSLAPGDVAIDDQSAERQGITTGSVVSVQSRKGTRDFTVSLVYQHTTIINGLIFGADDTAAMFALPAPLQAFVSVAPGADQSAVRESIAQLIAADPDISVVSMDDLIAAQAQLFSIILVFVQLLLGLAIIIAVLGVVNTLALSMTERTRELGLLRAVGMRRRQVMWMVTVESTVVSVFGALLGVAVGAGLGVAVFEALKEEGFDHLAIPWQLMGGYLIASVVVGLIAGLIPAVRAARQDVLAAIAYE